MYKFKAEIVAPQNQKQHDTMMAMLVRHMSRIVSWARLTPKGFWPSIMAVLCVGVMTFSAGMTSIGPMDRDEARFAQASKQMVMSGDYVTPRYQEELRAKKPAGIYWMQAAAAATFGIDDIASYRIPSVIGGLITIAVTTILAILILPPSQAVFAGMFMATSLLVVVEGHLAKSDSMLTAFIALQQIILWKIRQITKDRHYVSGKTAILFWAMMGIAILIKGPIAPVIALGTIAFIVATQKEWQFDSNGVRKWHWILSLRPLLGLIVLTVIVLPWVLLVTSATDGAFLSTAIKGDLVNKLQSGQESHGAPPGTYLMIIVLTFWPASLVIARAIRVVWQKRKDDHVIFLLGWIIPFWVIVELTPTKLPHYNMPVFAALAILTALGIGANLPPAKEQRPKPPSPEKPLMRAKRILSGLSIPRSLILGWEWLFMAAGPVLGIAILYIATFTQGSRSAAGFALLMSIAASIAAFFWQRRGQTRYLIGVLLAGGMMHMTVLGAVLPSLDGIRIAPRIKAELAEISPKPALITAAGFHEPSLVFLLGTDTLLFSPTEAALFLAEAEDGMALVESRSEKDFHATLNKLGLDVDAVRKIEGHNISRGQDVVITFYRRR